MGVGADLDGDALFDGSLQIPPVEVEPVRVGVELESNPGLGRARDDRVEVDRERFPPKELPPGWVTDDRQAQARSRSIRRSPRSGRR
jgi:hypothetical protein